MGGSCWYFCPRCCCIVARSWSNGSNCSPLEIRTCCWKLVPRVTNNKQQSRDAGAGGTFGMMMNARLSGQKCCHRANSLLHARRWKVPNWLQRICRFARGVANFPTASEVPIGSRPIVPESEVHRKGGRRRTLSEHCRPLLKTFRLLGEVVERTAHQSVRREVDGIG